MNQSDDEKTRSARFISAITHDLAQPLHAARLFASMLTGKIPDPKQQEIIDNIHESLEVSEKMLQEISLVGKLDAERLPIKIEAIKVQEIILDVISEFAIESAQRGVEVRFVSTNAFVMSDKEMLRRAIQRLVSNALRFTANGKVLLGGRKRGDNYLLEVWDNGIGIDVPDQLRVFEDFVRINNHDIYNQRCFGLGLGIVRRLCQQLGHEISLRSTIGKGSVFFVQLPLVSQGLSC